MERGSGRKQEQNKQTHMASKNIGKLRKRRMRRAVISRTLDASPIEDICFCHRPTRVVQGVQARAKQSPTVLGEG